MYKISIENFKKISKADVDLGSINVIIGANNSGKSSFIQAIQFGIGCAQSLELRSANWVNGKRRTLALDSTEFLYSPTREVANLRHGEPLTSSKTVENKKFIKFRVDGVAADSASIEISKGKNGGFTTSLKASSKIFGEEISNISRPFCVYVPGLAGIPISEKFEVPFTIRKSATRGDSNNYLRNILLSLSKDSLKWHFFTSNVNEIYPDIAILVSFDEHKSELISVSIKQNNQVLPLDLVGTGLLQIMQIFAYLEYFNPRLILLDEPDAHLHPSKQRSLATLLTSITERDHYASVASKLRESLDHQNQFQSKLLSEEQKHSLTLKKLQSLDAYVKKEKPIFIISTHSRYMLDSLDGASKTFYFNSGKITNNIENSKILQDIGAIDAEYLFNNKKIKYIFCTEDKVDNVQEKKSYLKKIVLASGFKEDEIAFHSYESCTKVDFAKILKDFVAKQIPGVQIILHFDRDQRSEDDQIITKLEEDCSKKGIELFITKYSELENYFCQPEHIAKIYEIEYLVAQEIYEQAKNALTGKTLQKIKDYVLNNRPDIYKQNGTIKSELVENHAELELSKNIETLIPGKELLGFIKNKIQNELKQRPDDILCQSAALMEPRLSAIANKPLN